MVSAASPMTTVLSSTIPDRLRALRERMRALSLDAVIVRSTDAYLNEYVPVDESTRVFITGFTGSMGDALITRDRALLFVDGRYALQASTEAKDFETTVVPLGTSIEEGLLAAFDEVAKNGVVTLGVETERVTCALMATIEARAKKAGLTVVPTVPSLVEEVVREMQKGVAAKKQGRIWSVSPALSGRTVGARLSAIAPTLAEKKLDGIVVIPLDALAWLTNLRGDHFAYQATFRGAGVALADRVIVAADARALTKASVVDPAVELVGEGGLTAHVRALAREREDKTGAPLALGFDPAVTPESVRRALVDAGASLFACDDPFLTLRTEKTPEEMRHMVDAFARADRAVKRLQTWFSTSVSRGERVTEQDVSDKLFALMKREGAWGLSFKTIPAAGKNGAIIHYGTPDAATPIREGTVFLLDCGAYFDGGYATDLTRTFLVGKGHVSASAEMKRLFTIVLKGAIAGMSARVPSGATGEQLDAIVRAPMWRAGINYAHGTGHGVGVNVHESPPRVAPNARGKLQVGQVFSIEPGVYLPDVGGVRIENLVTCVVDPDDARFIRVKPLTFSPFDERLIDRAMLSPEEKRFLAWFKKRFAAKDRLDDELPPL
jgi:Xaa-Pro aminopeptidase